MDEMKTVVETYCPFCGEVHYVTVSIQGLRDWENGALIQDALPELTADEREALISGMCPDCMKKYFGD